MRYGFFIAATMLVACHPESSFHQPRYLLSHRYSLPLPLFFRFLVVRAYANEVGITIITVSRSMG